MDLDDLIRVRSNDHMQFPLSWFGKLTTSFDVGGPQLTNEFKFSLAAVHHAHEAYLVPEVLKKAYGTFHTICHLLNDPYKRLKLLV